MSSLSADDFIIPENGLYILKMTLILNKSFKDMVISSRDRRSLEGYIDILKNGTPLQLNDLIFPGELYCITPSLQEGLLNFLDMHFNELKSNHKYSEYRKFIQNSNAGDHIYVAPTTKMKPEHYLPCLTLVRDINERKAPGDNLLNFLFHFGKPCHHYAVISSPPGQKFLWGNESPDLTCRFCGLSLPSTSFSDVAHTIPQALGNTLIFTKNECDRCNHRFGDTIEPALTNFLLPARITSKISGKKSFSKIKFCEGSSVTISPVSVTRLVDADEVEFVQKAKPQDIYRALCKIAVSVLPNEKIDLVKNTIEWINGKRTVKELPMVFEYLRHPNVTPLLPPSKQPIIIVFTRHPEITDDYPMIVGHFICGAVEYYYEVPLFIGGDGYIENFIKLLPIANDAQGAYRDFSQDTEKTLKFKTKVLVEDPLNPNEPILDEWYPAEFID